MGGALALGSNVPPAPIGLAMVVLALGSTAAAGPGWRGPWRRRLGSGAGLLVLGVGILLVAARSTGLAPAPPLSSAEAIAGPGRFEAVVESVSSPKGAEQIALLRVGAGFATGDGVQVEALLPRYPEIGAGDRIAVSGRLEPPGPDDFGAYLRRVGAAGSLRSATLELVAGPAGPEGVLDRIRRGSADVLSRALPEPQAGLADGILIGLRDRVDRDVATAFTTAGVSHIVAISGWNIAIVAATVAAILGARVGTPARVVITLVAIVGYTLVAGASPSVSRAALMAAIGLTARAGGRSSSAIAALGWAVVVLLLIDPASVADPGFALSSLATAGLIAWATPLSSRLAHVRGFSLPRWLAESLAISLAAEAATLPIVLLAFGRLAIVAPLANLVIVPIVPPAMAAGALALAAGWFGSSGLARTARGPPRPARLGPPRPDDRPGPSGGRRPVRERQPPAAVERRCGPDRGDRRRPDREWDAPVRSDQVRGTSTGMTQRHDATSRPRRPGRLVGAGLAGLALALAVTVAGLSAAPDGRIHITVLDVGQGDAILVEGDRGARMLIDGGPDPDRLILELDARIPPWDRRIDVLVLSHPHEDHAGGLPRLVEAYRIGRIFEPGMIGPGPAYHAFRADLALQARSPELLSTGDRLRLDSIDLRVLWPDRTAVPREPPDGGTSINNVSIVLLGTFGSQRFLLAGDIEQEIDPILLSRGLPRIDLLKVAHHGSRTSSTAAFLDAVRPKVAIVSVGAVNPYGHPAPETIARIEARGASLYRTDRNGSVEATLDGRTMTIQADHGGPALAARADAPSPRAGSALTGRPASPAIIATAFRCSVVPPSIGQGSPAGTEVPLTVTSPTGTAPTWTTAGAAGVATRRPASPAMQDRLYHRVDVHPLPGGGRGAPPVDPAVSPRPAPRPGGRRSGRLAGLADRCPGDPRQSAGGRSRGTPPRCRQGPPQATAAQPPDPRAPPW